MKHRPAMRLGIALFFSAGMMLAGQAPPSSASTPSAEEMFRAIRANQLDELKSLANAGGANVKDKLQTSPLHFAALYGNAASIKTLLEAGADPNALDNRGATPLVYAAYSFEKTKLLVDPGARVQVAATKGVT